MAPDVLLANAERLISDARFLHAAGRSRSAATLVVVAIEQFGAFVEASIEAIHPKAIVHMGIFGDRANAHAKRQDALAAHIYNTVQVREVFNVTICAFVERTRCGDHAKYLQWMKTVMPFEFNAEQKERVNNSPDMKTAKQLMGAVRLNKLRQLREYGLYENIETRFPDSAIAEAIELASKLRIILQHSLEWATPVPMEMIGVNLREETKLD